MGGFAARPFPPSNHIVFGILVFERVSEYLNMFELFGKLRFFIAMSPSWIVAFSKIIITFSDM